MQRITTKVSCNEAQFPGFADGFRTALHIELEEEARDVFLDRVLGYKKCFGDLVVAQSFGDEFEHFVFPFADVELFQFCLVEREFFFMDKHLFLHDLFFLQFPGEEDADEQKDDAESRDPYFGAPAGLEPRELRELEKHQHRENEQAERDDRLFQEKTFGRK